MDLLVNTVKKFCLFHGLDKTYWIGYSGGLDSHVLLHLFAGLRQDFPIKIHAVYINHGLSENATKWAAHCREVCHQQQIEFSTFSIEVKSLAEKNFEEVARDHRYAVFAKLLAVNDLLLTGHHKDDQAETVLLQMLRGAGPKGLAAMPNVKPFAQGLHARPLLDFTRDDLKKYAEFHQLHWIDDESNANTHFMRNFLRHEILPILKTRLPTVTQTLARVADNCAEAQQVLEEVAGHDLLSVKGSLPQTLSIHKLLSLNCVRQRHVLRAWLNQLNYPIPSALKLQQIQQNMLCAREDKTPHIEWNGVELRRYRDNLYAMPCLQPHDKFKTYEWDLSQPLKLPKIGTLQVSISPTTSPGLCADIHTVSVRFRQGGETLQLPGRSYHHDVKKLFQTWGVPPWQRDRIPLIYVDDQLAAIVGYAIGAKFREDKQRAAKILSIK